VITRADAPARRGSRTSLDKGRAESPSVREQHKWLTPHLLSRRPIYRWSGKRPSGALQRWRIQQLRYRTAGLCGLETSMEDFGFFLSSAMTT
jgi:hypothetical protein